MRKQALIYMIMAGTLALSGCRATSQNTAANASAVEQNAAQDGQNENNDGNGAPDENGAPDGKEAPDGKGAPDGNGAPDGRLHLYRDRAGYERRYHLGQHQHSGVHHEIRQLLNRRYCR